jgi:hypothetical protein
MPEKTSPMFNLALALPFQDQGKPLEIKGVNVKQAEALPFESVG